MDVRELNRLLERGRMRADELEGRLADILHPILNRAADQAARRFSENVLDFMTASVLPISGTFAAPSPSATMVAVMMRPEEAQALAEDGGESAGTLHVTLAMLGDTAEEDVPKIVDALRGVAAEHAPLVGTVGGVGAFDDNGAGHPAILLPDVPGLVELRQAVCLALIDAGIDYARNHGFAAHITIRYGDGDPPNPDSVGLPLHFDDLVVARGDVPHAIPLIGAPAVTAAAPKNTQPPSWGAPSPDELLDIDALVQALLSKTGPVRLAFLERVMTDTLEKAGLSFDVTNPFTAKVLAQTASQVTHIAETTRANVMRIIDRAYNEGLSIPNTADLIRAGMKAATPARATLIARTELAGAVNGGSLAAVQIVEAATGAGMSKVWLTAAGAPHPRHEDYEGLNGQTAPLDGYFHVGDSELQYPGDPDGDPGEVINCRCAIVYSEGDGQAAADSEG